MNADDLLVEVRSSSLDRVGRVLAEHVNLVAEVPANDVGNWTLTLPLDSPMGDYLASEGYGIVVSDRSTGEVMFSGPSTSIGLQYDSTFPMGALVIGGATDEVAIRDALAWPDPENPDEATQAFARDEREGLPWVIIEEFVVANIGVDAHISRRNLKLVTEMDVDDFADGTDVVKASARFDNLLELVQGIATPAKVILRCKQSYGASATLRFSIRPSGERTVVMDPTRDMSSLSLTLEAPGSTRIFVGGDGSSTSRTFYEYSDDKSLDAEEVWGRRIEKFAAATGGTTELETAGKLALAEDGFAKLTARFEPSEALRATYGTDWSLGDNASVSVAGKRYSAPITGLLVKADADGLRVGVTLGDVIQTGNQVNRRISALETYR